MCTYRFKVRNAAQGKGQVTRRSYRRCICTFLLRVTHQRKKVTITTIYLSLQIKTLQS